MFSKLFTIFKGFKLKNNKNITQKERYLSPRKITEEIEEFIQAEVERRIKEEIDIRVQQELAKRTLEGDKYNTKVNKTLYIAERKAKEEAERKARFAHRLQLYKGNFLPTDRRFEQEFLTYTINELKRKIKQYTKPIDVV